MVKAFVMIDAEPGKEKALEDAIRKMANVRFCYQVTGEHDMITLVDTMISDDLAVVVSSIRKLEGVRDTNTELVLETDDN